MKGRIVFGLELNKATKRIRKGDVVEHDGVDYRVMASQYTPCRRWINIMGDPL